jgi:hypothetical protein
MIEVQSVLLPGESVNTGYGYGYDYGYGTGSALLPDENISSGYMNTGYGYGSGTSSYKGYVTDYNNSYYTSYNPHAHTGYSSGYTNTSYTSYGPPHKGYANGYFNVTHTGYGIPQYSHYGPPAKLNYQNVNDCNKVQWKITHKPETSYGAYLPTKSYLNNGLYTWLTSATKRDKWSKEIGNNPYTAYSYLT